MGFVIAIDGPAASGKGVIASRLGEAFGLPVLDTGLIYRAVAHAASDLDDEAALERVASALEPKSLENPALRTREAGEAASRAAAHPRVRAALIGLQREFAAREPGAILDGRDIGTVIAPHAQSKLFVTAAPEVRADRRWRQLQSLGESVALRDILDDIRRRDERDSGRAAAPLRPAPDAILLDTSNLGIEAAFEAARRLVDAARGA